MTGRPPRPRVAEYISHGEAPHAVPRLASFASEATALLAIIGIVVMARSGGSVGGAILGMLVPGVVLAGVALVLPPGQTRGIIAFVSPAVACFCSALGAAWREIVPSREPVAS